MGGTSSKEGFEVLVQPPGTPPTPCPPGTYGNSIGLTTSACSGPCSAGYYCTTGSTTPTQNPCPAGKYCLAGTGDPLSSNPPASCPAGTSSPSGSSSCTPCQDGYSSTPGTLCSPCSINTYSVSPCVTPPTPALQLTVIAGTPGTGVAGINGVNAISFVYSPMAVVTDSCGTLYVADGNNLIRKIYRQPGSLATIMTSFAGTDTGIAGSTFNAPQGLAIDSTDTLYVADTNNHMIRKITPQGIVSPFAGSGFAGNVDGTSLTAQFSSPTGVAVDSAGNVYVADKDNSLIRKVTPNGTVSTLAGSTPGSADGTGTAASFLNPRALTIDSTGNLYVADSGNHIIRKITPAWVVTTVAGLAGVTGGRNGAGSCARFNSPASIIIDTNGALYVSEPLNNTIRKIVLVPGSPAGVCVVTNQAVATVSSVIAPGLRGYVNSAVTQLNAPYGLFIDSKDAIFVADSGNQVIGLLSIPVVPPQPSSCVTLCKPCCAGTMATIGSSICSPYPAVLISPLGTTLSLNRGIYQNSTGTALVAALTTSFSSSLVVSSATSISDFSNCSLHLLPGWVAFGYINRLPADVRIDLDMTPYTGSSSIRAGTYILVIVSQRELTYTTVRSTLNVPTLISGVMSGAGSTTGSGSQIQQSFPTAFTGTMSGSSSGAPVFTNIVAVR